MRLLRLGLIAVVTAALLIASAAPISARPGTNTLASTSYYVDSVDGHDDNTGLSSEQAFASLDRIDDVILYPGDTVYLRRGGVWNLRRGFRSFEIHQSGTEAQPIRVRAYGEGELPLIQSGPDIRGTGLTVNGDWVDVRDLAVSGMTKQGIDINGNHCTIADVVVTQTCMCVRLDGDHNTISDCQLSGRIPHDEQCSDTKNTAVFTRGDDNALIRLDIHHVGFGALLDGVGNSITHSTIQDLYMDTNTPGGNDDSGAVGVWVRGNDAVVAYNRMLNCIADSYDYGVDGGAVEFYGGVVGAYVHHNYATGCDGFIEIGGGRAHDCTLAYNVSLNNGMFGVCHLDGTFESDVRNLRIEHNTIVESLPRDEEGWSMLWFTANPNDEVSLHNNILSVADFSSIIKIRHDRWDIIHEHNLYHVSSGEGDVGFNLGAGEIAADPLFVDVAIGDLRLSASSPAIDGGTDLGYSADHLDVVVPQGAAPDMGAYEHALATSTAAPTATPTATRTATATATPTDPSAPTVPLIQRVALPLILRP